MINFKFEALNFKKALNNKYQFSNNYDLGFRNSKLFAFYIFGFRIYIIQGVNYE